MYGIEFALETAARSHGQSRPQMKIRAIQTNWEAPFPKEKLNPKIQHDSNNAHKNQYLLFVQARTQEAGLVFVFTFLDFISNYV